MENKSEMHVKVSLERYVELLIKEHKFDGIIKVKKEQKYNVNLNFKVKSSYGTIGIYLFKEGDEVLVGDNFIVYNPKEEEYMLTEQEIRGFQNGDVLFGHFAKPVEE